MMSELEFLTNDEILTDKANVHSFNMGAYFMFAQFKGKRIRCCVSDEVLADHYDDPVVSNLSETIKDDLKNRFQKLIDLNPSNSVYDILTDDMCIWLNSDNFHKTAN